MAGDQALLEKTRLQTKTLTITTYLLCCHQRLWQERTVAAGLSTLRRDGFDGFGAQCDLRDFWRHELINS